MEDATISEQPKEQPLYQQGRYPSVLDTDDMVFELGKQVVNHLNHEKLIGQIVKQTEAIQRENLQLKSLKIQTEERVAPLELKAKQLEESNKLYEMNNRKLDEEIVKLRSQASQKDVDITGIKSELLALQTQITQRDAAHLSEIDRINASHQAEIITKEEVYNIAVDKLKKEHKEEIKQVKLDSKKKKPYDYR